MDKFRKGVPAGREQHVQRLRGMKCHKEGQVLVIQVAGYKRWGQERMLA